MKVELEKLRIQISPLSRVVYAGVLNKNKDGWINKIEVDEQFKLAALAKWNRKPEIIEVEGVGTFEITVKRIK